MKQKYIVSVFLLIILLSVNIESVFSGEAETKDTTYMEVQLNAEERSFLDSLGTLRVVIDDDFAPITYYDEDSKNFGGIAVDVLEILSHTLGFEYEIIRDESLTWADRLDLVKNNQVHILGGASINDTRKEYGYFTSELYFQVNYALIGAIDNHIIIKSLEDINKYKIGLVEGVTINEYIQSTLTGDNVKVYVTMDEALLALSKGEIDLVPENQAVFTELYFNGERFDYEIIYSIYDITNDYAFFLPKNEMGHVLSDILSKGMREIDIYRVISNRYENKSMFLYYKEYTDLLQKKDAMKQSIIITLTVAMIALVVLLSVIKSKNISLAKLANMDNLTKLKNRNALFNDYRQREKLHDQVIIFIDLDDFKSINDNYGHASGDLVLKEMAIRLLEYAHKSDVYRIGGDELLIIKNKDDKRIIEELLETIKRPIVDKQNEYSVSGSIGFLEVSEFPKLQLSELINLADYAMLEAKAQGKGIVLKVTTEMVDKYYNLLGKGL